MPMQSKLYGMRKEKGLSQKDMAKLLGISETSYRDRELGRLDFKLSEMTIIAKEFGKTLNQIFLHE